MMPATADEQDMRADPRQTDGIHGTSAGAAELDLMRGGDGVSATAGTTDPARRGRSVHRSRRHAIDRVIIDLKVLLQRCRPC